MKTTFGSGKRQKKEVMELDITSLLDILVILLVFLLKSYNASSLTVNPVKDLSFANSSARKLGEHAVIVQVDKNNQIWIKGRRIATIDNRSVITELKDHLKELQLKEGEPKSEKKDKKKPINLILDKTLPYKSMQTIMHTSALAGHTQFKFIVKGNY